MNYNGKVELFPVYSRSGKLLSRYAIDFPTLLGSSNLSFMIVCVALLLLCASLFAVRLVRIKRPLFGQSIPITKPIWTILVFLAVAALVWYLFGKLFQYGFHQGFFIPNSIHIGYFFLLLFVSSLVLLALAFLLHKMIQPWVGVRNQFLMMLAQLVFWGILLTVVYDRQYTKFENQQIQETAQKLSQERDPAFEQSYLHFLEETRKDTFFNAMLLSDGAMEEVMMDYMRNFLFDSVMNQYNLGLTLCSPQQELVVKPFNVVAACQEFFEEKLKANHAVDLGNGLFYVDDNTLDPNYLSVFTPAGDTTKQRSVYLEFSIPVIPQAFGLSRLLYDDQSNILLTSSVACYRDSLLIYKYGSFIYPNYLSDFNYPVNTFSYGPKMKHYLHQADEHKVLAISYERRGWREMSSPFAVFFFILLILFLLVYFVGGLRRETKGLLTLSRRFQMVVLVALGISFFVVGPISVIFLRRLYNQQVNETHFDKTRTLSLDITSEVDFSFLKDPGFKTELDEILRHYSETFFTDINVYSVEGEMLATTSPELIELQIQSPLMNAEAFHNMQGDRSLYFIHEETMGNAVYQSSYIAIQDDTGKTLAFLNIPYFTSRSDLRSEIVHYVLTYINIVLLIIFIFVPIVLLVTRRMTHPLVQLQERMRRVDINKSNEKLEWKRKDEIGALINQYNQLVVELEKSAAELKRTTTESAWRGVARQVAHEIHNSLTPMRLSVQLLQRAVEQQSDDLEERVQRTTATLLEQIDALSDIASSFSQYAKLPVNNPQPFDLAELVGNLVNLYDNVENIEFSYDFDAQKDYTFNGDKTNLNSAIGNIIKNAVQAVAAKPKGRIAVSLRSTETAFIVSVKDNGKGIREEDKKMIFVPNFTTKTGGSGVGLSLAYNIIHSAGGTITFESKEGEGTEFVIELPRNTK
jgi:signal transduction histidine kinase